MPGISFQATPFHSQVEVADSTGRRRAESNAIGHAPGSTPALGCGFGGLEVGIRVIHALPSHSVKSPASER
jgi:hypothetical protein